MQTPLNAVPQSAGQLPYHLMADFSADDVGLIAMDDGLMSATKQSKVLVVDDSLTERTHLARIIQAAGYEVMMASSGNEAVALLAEHQPTAVFLDIIMDDGDGYKACRSIKRNAATANIPVIMVSSKANAVDRKWAEKLGASDYIVKPYEDEVILQALASI